MDEGRKRVLAIVVGILVARHLKTAEDYCATIKRIVDGDFHGSPICFLLATRASGKEAEIEQQN